MRFKNAKELYILDFTGNSIKILKNGVFKNATGLGILNLQKNKIKSIGVNAFINTALGYVLLNNNLLNYIKAGVFDHSPELYCLDMSYNNISIIPKTLFKNNLNLKSLLLEHNQIKILENGTFDNLLILTDLNLSNNKIVAIGKIPDKNFDFTLENNLLQSYTIGSFIEEVNIYI